MKTLRAYCRKCGASFRIYDDIKTFDRFYCQGCDDVVQLIAEGRSLRQSAPSIEEFATVIG